jgi:phosphoserine phosphatase RsbU/P
MINEPQLSLPSTLSSRLLSNFQEFKTSVLIIDDQKIIIEAVKRMLADQTDIEFHYCLDPNQALEMALQVKPTVILQDLVMPECDGLTLVKYFRSNPATKNIPIIVLSAKEDPSVKAEVFAVGGNDYIVKLPDKVELIARIRYHSRGYILLLERNEAYAKLEESQRVLNAEIAEAAAYVRSLLPSPLNNGIQTHWRYIPSTQLGGDAFGYYWLDDRYFVIYLLDVCGHGVGAALLSISVINVLRSQNLPKADFLDPKSVLKALNLAFQMDKQNNMFFTIWYGVYDRQTQQIIYANGGHPPAILITGKTAESAQVIELKTPGVVIGALPDAEFQNDTVNVLPFNHLIVFSDGVYEIAKPDGKMFELQEFIKYFSQLISQKNEDLDQIVRDMQQLQGGKKIFADDFSILKVSFQSK